MPAFLLNPFIVFSVTLFSSAFLLFLVQPMIGKITLPKFGGTPAVWNTCMMFYQACLLAGYTYSHVLSTRFPLRRQIKIHLFVLALPIVTFLIFPVGVYRGFTPPGDLYPAPFVIIMLTMLIGIPFLVVSTTAPLLQRWFSETGHPAAKDPYFLYAASNAGSLLALIAYPFLVEIYLPVTWQGIEWMVGFLFVAAMVFQCSRLLSSALPAEQLDRPKRKQVEEEAEVEAEVGSEAITTKVGTKKLRAKDRAKLASLEAFTRDLPKSAPPESNGPTASGPAGEEGDKPVNGEAEAPDSEPEVKSTPAESSTPPQPALAGLGNRVMAYLSSDILRWTLLAMIPSSLMLSVTTYMATDIASFPLLWLGPLALYLLSFIIVFSKTANELRFARWLLRLIPYLRETVDKRGGDHGSFGLHQIIILITPVVMLLLVFKETSKTDLLGASIFAEFAIHLTVFFIIALLCHGELAQGRPEPKKLTGYYLCMSVGGMLGGVFNALVAPVVFNTIAEYHIVLVLSAMLIPSLSSEKKTPLTKWIDTGLAGALGMAGLYVGFFYMCKWFNMTWLVEALNQNVELLKELPMPKDIPGFESQGLGFVVMATLVALAGAYMWFGKKEERLNRALDIALPICLCLLTIVIIAKSPFRTWTFDWLRQFINAEPARLALAFTYGIPVCLCYGFAEQPIRFGLGVAALFLASSLHTDTNHVVHQERGFFGVLKVERQFYDGRIGRMRDYPFPATDLPEGVMHPRGTYVRLLHGTTLHGMQLYDSDADLVHIQLAPLIATNPIEAMAANLAIKDVMRNSRFDPLTYYHRTGPIGQIYETLMPAGTKEATRDVAFVGLGTGTMASYVNFGQKATFYEIDPQIVRIAKKYFTFLRDCKGEHEFAMGDARLKMQEKREKGETKKYKLIVVDAFSSDAIPTHLITREALELYRDMIADDGIMAIHISNRYLRLGPVLANIATELGLVAIKQYDNNEGIQLGKTSSDWVMIAKNMAAFGPLQEKIERWPNDPHRAWSDVLVKPEAAKFSDADLSQWKDYYLARRERDEVETVKEEMEKNPPSDLRAKSLERLAEIKRETTDKNMQAMASIILGEEAQKQAKLNMEEQKKKLDAKSKDELKRFIQEDIDRQWERGMEVRRKIGLWTDDYQSILSTWR